MKKLLIPVFACTTVAASGAFANCRSLEPYYMPGAPGSPADSETCKRIDELHEQIQRENRSG